LLRLLQYERDVFERFLSPSIAPGQPKLKIRSNKRKWPAGTETLKTFYCRTYFLVPVNEDLS